MNLYHQEILKLIKAKSGKPTQHTFLNSYLGSEHPRYPISVPVLRALAKNWMKEHQTLSAKEISALVDSLVAGESFTEKSFAGILLDYCTETQRKFNPARFERWLKHLEGWAEVDSLCTGRYSEKEIVAQWSAWETLLQKLSKSKNIQLRRASLVLLCSPLRKSSEPFLAGIAFENIQRLKHEKEILITKAISWVLRSMVKHHRKAVEKFMKEETGLPAIAVRETKKVLETGIKNKKK